MLAIPRDALVMIFAFFDLATITSLLVVCRGWRQLLLETNVRDRIASGGKGIDPLIWRQLTKTPNLAHDLAKASKRSHVAARGYLVRLV